MGLWQLWPLLGRLKSSQKTFLDSLLLSTVISLGKNKPCMCQKSNLWCSWIDFVTHSARQIYLNCDTLPESSMCVLVLPVSYHLAINDWHWVPIYTFFINLQNFWIEINLSMKAIQRHYCIVYSQWKPNTLLRTDACSKHSLHLKYASQCIFYYCFVKKYGYEKKLLNSIIKRCKCTLRTVVQKVQQSSTRQKK